MHVWLDIVAIILLAAGLMLMIVTRSYRTDIGKTTPWYRKLTPYYKRNPYYTERGQELLRMGMHCASLGAIIFLIASLVK